MELFYIILLILLGLLFLVAEIVFLPGISIGGLLAMTCYGGAIYLAFGDFGTVGGLLAVVVVLAVSIVATVVSLRAKTWQRFSLRQQIRSSSMHSPADEVACGARGVTVSRLAPMGIVEIGGRRYEAKSSGAYIDPRTEVEVAGFENFSVVVKRID